MSFSARPKSVSNQSSCQKLNLTIPSRLSRIPEEKKSSSSEKSAQNEKHATPASKDLCPLGVSPPCPGQPQPPNNAVDIIPEKEKGRCCHASDLVQ